MDWSGLADGIGATLAGLGDFVLKLLIFLVILLIGWLIAKAIAKGLTFLFKKIGFQKLLDKAGLTKLLAPTGIDPLTLVVQLVYYFILLITLQLALGAFGPNNPVSEIVTSIVAFLPRAFVAVIIVIVVTAIANFVGDLMRPALSKFRYGRILTTIVVVAIIALGAIAALNQIGIAVTVTMPLLIAALAAIAGIAIVGVGGGLISPMRGRWEKWLGALEAETTNPSAPAPAPATAQAPVQTQAPAQAPAQTSTQGQVPPAPTQGQVPPAPPAPPAPGQTPMA